MNNNSTHKFLNIAMPLVTLILVPILMVPYMLFNLLLFIRNLVSPENLATKVVIITGSASGIGEQIAYEYGRKGANLSLVDIKMDNLVAVAEKAKSLGSPDVITIQADVSNPQDCKRFVDQTVNHFGHLDHLVNNAGTNSKVELVEDMQDPSVHRPLMEVNFWGAVYGSVYAIPHLKKRKGKGKIVVIASACGWCPLPRLSLYNASKAALISFFESVRTEIGWAIGITIVTPGFIKTYLADYAVHHSQGTLGIIPMGSAEECAKAVVKGVCRGDLYVTEPSWIKTGFSHKLFFPQLLDWAFRLAFKIPSNSPPYEQHKIA